MADNVLEKTKDTIKIKTLVSKGTYIRSLVRDICNDLGIIGTMIELIRTKQNNITLDECNTLDEIRNNNYKIYPMIDFIPYKKQEADEATKIKISNGVKLDNIYNIEDKVAFTYNNELLGIYIKDNEKLRVWKNFI